MLHTGDMEIHIHELRKDLREPESVHSTSLAQQTCCHVIQHSVATCQATPPQCWICQSTVTTCTQFQTHSKD